MRPILLALLLAAPLLAQTATPPPAPQHDANFDAERKQANDLFLAGKILDSLPLYEDLCRQDQTIAVFAERHGSGLLRKSATLSDPAAQKAMNDAGMAEIRRAQKLGDNSAYVQDVLSAGTKSIVGSAISGLPLSVGYTYRGNAQAQSTMKDAEAAFGREDVPGALKLYQKAAEQDPKLYNAALYTGDMYFRQNDPANAGIWFQKAIAIDPDRDTAYRYWGDALFKAGNREGARDKYIQAVLAEPYGRPGWLSLQQWAKLTNTPLVTPRIAIPQYTAKDGVLTPDPALESEAARANGRSSWLVYQACRVKHAGPSGYKFSFGVGADGKVTPSGNYHSLAEELECLRATATDIRTKIIDGTLTQSNLDPSLATLLALDKTGLLECWILLNNADIGIRFDYPAYRKDHMDQLTSYMTRYIIRPTPH
jgi:tetratricopeptide (TPR) repeat protein